MDPTDKSLQDIEKMYSKKPVTSQPDQNYDTLKVSSDELDASIRHRIHETADNSAGIYIGSDFGINQSTMEARSFLNRDPSSAINYKYSTEVKQLRDIARMWGFLTLSILTIEFFYFGVNFWVSVGRSRDLNVSEMTPVAQNLYLFMLEANDFLFFSVEINIFICIIGIFMCATAVVLLALERFMTFFVWAEKSYYYLDLGFKGFNIIILLGIMIKILTLIFNPILLAIVLQVIKLVIFVTGFFCYRKTKHYKGVHHKLLEEVVDRAKEDENLLNDLYDHWEQMYEQ